MFSRKKAEMAALFLPMLLLLLLSQELGASYAVSIPRGRGPVPIIYRPVKALRGASAAAE